LIGERTIDVANFEQVRAAYREEVAKIMAKDEETGKTGFRLLDE